MSRVDEFKKHLGGGEVAFLDGYLASINSLFDGLDLKGALIKRHSADRVERIQKFIRTSNAPAHLLNNVYNFTNGDKSKLREKEETLRKIGWKVDNLGEQFGSIICHSHQVTSERLKLHLVTIIDFKALGLKGADKKPLGEHIKVLKKFYPKNKFVQFLDTKIRNAVTHYSYFFKRDTLYLCDGYFDTNPQEMSLADFMKETKRLNILTECFFLSFLDRHSPGGALYLDI